MSVSLELRGICKVFPGVVALDGVNLSLVAGSVHALLGENGAGKSTLINVLSGVLTPDAGEVAIDGQRIRLIDARDARRHGIVTVHQELDLFDDLTVGENVGLLVGLRAGALGWFNWREQRQRAAAALEAAGESLSIDERAERLTPAQRQLVEIVAAMSQSARVHVLDEPTSSLSDEESRRLFQHVRRLRDEGAAILYVSHRLDEVFALADESTVLRDGRVVWTGPLAETTREMLVAHMVGQAVEPRRFVRREPGPVRLRCRGMSATDLAFRDISLEVCGGEILGLYGLVGAGRTEWAQAVFGLRHSTAGETFVDGQSLTGLGSARRMDLGLAYVPEDRQRQGLCKALDIRSNTVLASLRRLGRFLLLRQADERRAASGWLSPLAVKMKALDQAVGALSGGNQQKVVLGRWLGREPTVLILDEPTRGVDVAAKAEIHALIHRLAAEGRAIVLISSDLSEVLTHCHRVGVFREGRLVAAFDAESTNAEQIATTALPDGDGEARRHGDAATTKGGGDWRRAEWFGREVVLAAVLLVLFAAVEWRSGRFLQIDNLIGLATDASLLGFCALAAGVVLIAGGLDISLGAIMVLSAGVGGKAWAEGQPLAIAAVLAMCVGAACGFANAAVSLVGRVHPIVVTLGAMNVYRGLALWWIREDVHVPGEARAAMLENILGLPVLVWLGMALFVGVWIFLTRTLLGRELYALGSNPDAAHRVGIDRNRVWLSAFTIQGAMLGLAGFLYLARSGVLQPSSFEDVTLEAIAAAVVGGVAITGGRGSVAGIALGAMLLASLGPACVFLRVSPYWQRALVGSVLVAAVTADALWRSRRRQ